MAIGYKSYNQIHCALSSFGKTNVEEVQFEDYDWGNLTERKPVRPPTAAERYQQYTGGTI